MLPESNIDSVINAFELLIIRLQLHSVPAGNHDPRSRASPKHVYRSRRKQAGELYTALKKIR